MCVALCCKEVLPSSITLSLKYGKKKCISDMPAPVSGEYVSRCLLAVSRVGGAATCRSRWILKKYFSV